MGFAMQTAPTEDVFADLKVFVEDEDVKIGRDLGEGSQGFVNLAELIPSGNTNSLSTVRKMNRASASVIGIQHRPQEFAIINGTNVTYSDIIRFESEYDSLYESGTPLGSASYYSDTESSEGSKERKSNQLSRHELIDKTLSATQSLDDTCFMAPVRGSNPDEEPDHTGSYQSDETEQGGEQLHRIREDTVSESCRRKENVSICDEYKEFTKPTVCTKDCELTMSPRTISDYEAAIWHHLLRLQTHSEANNAAIWTRRVLAADGKRQKKIPYQNKGPKVPEEAKAANDRKKIYWKEKQKMDEKNEKLEKLYDDLPKLLDDLKERISKESDLYHLLSTRDQFWPSIKSLSRDPIIDGLKKVIADKVGTLNLSDEKKIANRQGFMLFRCMDKMLKYSFETFYDHGKELKVLINKLQDLKEEEEEPLQAKRIDVETMKKKIFSDLSLLLADSDLVSGHGVIRLLFSLCRHAKQCSVNVRTYFTADEQKKLDAQLFEAIPHFHRNVREKALVLGEESLMRLRTVRSGIQFLSDDLATTDSPDLYFAVSDFMESHAVFVLDKKLRIFEGMRGQYDRGDDCEDLRGVPYTHFWWSDLERGDSKRNFGK